MMSRTMALLSDARGEEVRPGMLIDEDTGQTFGNEIPEGQARTMAKYLVKMKIAEVSPVFVFMKVYNYCVRGLKGNYELMFSARVTRTEVLELHSALNSAERVRLAGDVRDESGFLKEECCWDERLKASE